MKFNIEDYKNDKYAMHCKTKEEAISFCNYLNKIGKHWATCSKDYFKETDYTILKWSDFMEDTVENTSESENKDITKFSKEDLQTGDIILRRDNTTAIFIKEFNTFVSTTGYLSLEDYTEDLRLDLSDDNETSDYDVIKVSRPLCQNDVQFNAFNRNLGKVIFDRGYIKEMTLEEIEKELGYKIRIKADVQ